MRISFSIFLSACFYICFFPVFLSADELTDELADGVVDQEIVQTVFSGNETMHFSISWSGGIKIGDLTLALKPDGTGGFAIHARVTDYGLFKFFYPVDDVFTTFVRGERKLPYRYEVLQREGHGSVTKRLSLFDQSEMMVRYTRDEDGELLFPVTGPVYNEFSSFYITRSMKLEPGVSFLVPTFADKKRNAVKVLVKGREDIDTLFGKVRTITVMPLMKFKGLYDKDGDTVIWFTDDVCRVPVKINSKIVVGSLTAELRSFSNSSCDLYGSSSD